MASPGLAFDLVGWRDNTRGKFAKYSEELAQRQEDVANDVMAKLKESAEQLSPVGVSEKEQDEVTFATGWKTEVTRTDTGAEATLMNVAPYWRFVIEPTKPHAIEPKEASVLHFMVDGEDVFATHVWHPGTKGNDIPGKLREQMGKFANDSLATVARKVITDLDAVFWR